MRPEERAARAVAYERARPEILVHVPESARRVLDLGCATGTTGAALKAQAARTRDRDRDRAGVRRRGGQGARPRDRRRRGDLPTLDGPFDALIAADILEHLADPWTTLRAYAELLEPGATVIVSLPNVAHWSTYAYLARGTWPRKPEGIFDATHLRWFTLRDAKQLLTQAGITPGTVVRRRWLLTRGSRLDRLAPPLSSSRSST